jgi:hypothetical protein
MKTAIIPFDLIRQTAVDRSQKDYTTATFSRSHEGIVFGAGIELYNTAGSPDGCPLRVLVL